MLISVGLIYLYIKKGLPIKIDNPLIWRVAVIEIIGKKPLFLVACGFLDFDFSFFATVIQTIAEKLEFTQKRYVHIT